MFANEKREQLRALMAEFFSDVDALLMPVAMVPAIPHDHSDPFPERVIRGGRREPSVYGPDGLGRAGRRWRTCRPPSCPSVAPPSGLPVGVQIVGPYLEDRTTLAVARCIEELLGGFVAPPS